MLKDTFQLYLSWSKLPSVVMIVKKYLYLGNLPNLPHCRIQNLFPTNSHTVNGAHSAERFISPLIAHIYIARIKKPPPLTHPSLSSLQSRQWWKPSESHSDLSQLIWYGADNWKGEEEIPEKEFTKSILDTWTALSKMFQTRLALQYKTSSCNVNHCVSSETMIMSNK